MIHVIVRERDAAAQATEPITSGSVGLACSFRFSEDWDGLGKVAIFQGSGQIVDVALVGEESCAVPHEVLQRALGHLKIGVYGTGDQGQRVTPTVWADAGRILPGVEPSQIEPTPATQSLVQQILEAAEEAAEIAQSVRNDADAGAFDGEPGPKGDKGDPGESGLAYYTANVSAAGVLTMQADMPSPTEIADTFSAGTGLLPLLRLHDRGWFYNDAETFARIYLDLRYSQRHQSGGKYAVFEGTFENRDGSGPSHIWVKGVEANGGTTWTIGKEALGSGGGSSEEIFWAAYNETTEAEITAAVTAGKTVLLNCSDEIFYLTNKLAVGPSGSAWQFSSAGQTGVRVTWVSGSYWNTFSTKMIPTKTSDLSNDSGFVNASGAASAAPVQSVNGQTGAAALSASDVGAAPAVQEVTVSTAGAVTQALEAGKLYHFTGALTALTITLTAAPSGQLAQYHFDFNSGSTAPTVTLPGTVVLPDDNTFEASKHYEVDILNNYGAVMAWATS